VTPEELATYPPLGTLKLVAEGVWIADGPVIRFGMLWPKMPFPTRMTIIRLAGRNLFLHSPTPLTPALRAEIDATGVPRWIIGPNRLHYWWIPQWQAAYPDARAYLAPRIKEQAAGRIEIDGIPLEAAGAHPWDAEIETLAVTGSYMTEFEFFHHASGTLVLTDLIENFEPRKLGSFLMRWLTRLGGAQDPDGQTPRDMRLTFAKHKPQLRAAIGRMIAWNPERVILAHGRWYERDGTAELRRALRWALDAP
jgi:hypothetical protein